MGAAATDLVAIAYLCHVGIVSGCDSMEEQVFRVAQKFAGNSDWRCLDFIDLRIVIYYFLWG